MWKVKGAKMTDAPPSSSSSSPSPFTFKFHRARQIVLCVLAALVAADIAHALMMTSPADRDYVTNIGVVITSGAAFVFAAAVLVRQRLAGDQGRAYMAIALGVFCWFAGEVIWTVEENVLEVEQDISAADVLWLAGYGFFSYSMYRTYRIVKGGINGREALIVSLVVAVFISNTIQFLLSSEAASIHQQQQQGGWISASDLIRLAYPVGSGILIIPSMLLAGAFRGGNITYMPWLLISIAFIITSSADMLFTYLLGLDALKAVEWMTNMLYDAGYMFMAAALYWHNRFVVFSKKAAEKRWQESNK
jgi:hypothetical protein